MTRTAALALALLALAACGGSAGRLRPEAAAGVDLAGTWRLDPAASDDPQAMIHRMQQDMMKRMRRHREYGPPDDEETPGMDDDSSMGTERRMPRGGGQSGGQSGDQGEDPRGRTRSGSASEHARNRFIERFPYTLALGSALSSDSLRIEQSPSRFAVIRGDDRRTFTPGGESVVSVADGVADQHSGWSGREYVIEVRPQVGPHVIERYGLSADGRQLVEKYTLTDEGLPKLQFTRVYDRGPLAERPLPTSN